MTLAKKKLFCLRGSGDMREKPRLSKMGPVSPKAGGGGGSSLFFWTRKRRRKFIFWNRKRRKLIF
jgi:hypothetical protein